MSAADDLVVDAWERFVDRIAANRGLPPQPPAIYWKHGTYCGPLDGLAQQPALLRPDPDSPDHVLAQFDALGLVHDGEQMAFNWHRFPAKHFSTGD